VRKTNCLVITLVFFIRLAALGRELPPTASNHRGPHGAVQSTSVFTSRPDDPTATYFIPGRFPITSDGRIDVSDALQGAIRDIKTNHNFGILFIPEGKYLITKTIYIPTAIRLIGYGRTRPLFILGKSSPGFQSADPADKGQAKYMFWFTSGLPASSVAGAVPSVPDAGASTFYSAMSNIDIRIEEGNPAAVALRTHFAQHSYISHVDISIGNGKAGLFDVGNEMEDVRFFGGDYGIYTTKPSPGWPFMMVDTWFEGQRKAAIRTREAGLTIVRMTAHNVPTVIDIDSNYHEKLFMEDCRFDGVTGPAIRISNEENSLVQINLRNVTCRNVPVLTISRAGNQQITAAASAAGAKGSQGSTSASGSVNPIVTGTVVTSPIYNVRSFTAGLQMDNWSADPKYSTTKDLQPLTSFPAAPHSDIPALPLMEGWVNLLTLGAKGDGETDDTKVIQDAIDRYPTIYVPQGWYRISNTLRLRPNTVLIGLNPIATQFQLAENTRAFGGFGDPVALLESSRGGNNIVTGIGLSTGASNPRAVGCKWMAGADSYLNDVKFIGGHGSISRPGTPRTQLYQQQDKDWDTQYWSLWITDNGGGTFKNIWSASTYATAGAYISNTSTPGRIYAMSIEHHVRNEIRFNKVSNWKVYALQLEEESRESSECQPLEIGDCHNMRFANLYMFRVIRVIKPYPYSIRLWGGSNLEFLNVHNYSQIKYTTTVPLYDINTNTEIRPWEFARLFVSSVQAAPGAAAVANPGSGAASRAAIPATGQGIGTASGTTNAASFATSAALLATGFEFAQSATSDSHGNIYFCESRMRRIYRWSPVTRTTTLLADYPWEPLSLACDQKDNLLVVFKYVPKPGWLIDGHQETFTNPPDAAGTSFSGWGNSGFATWIYSVDPENPDESIRLLPRVPMGSIAHPYKVLYPAHRWRDYHDFNTVSVNKPEECFVAPDGVTIIPVVYDLARSTSLATGYPGKPIYLTDEYDKRTVRTNVSPEGYLSDLTYFAERGEFSSVADRSGHVYIADGEVYRYDPQGKQTGLIPTPERPTGITFGKDQKTLYITGHHSLYEVAIP
jgi:sugar lactone lactonase YvrE